MDITINELSARLNSTAATARVVSEYALNSMLDDKKAFENVILSLEIVSEQLCILAAMGAILNDTANVSDYDSIPIDIR